MALRGPHIPATQFMKNDWQDWQFWINLMSRYAFLKLLIQQNNRTGTQEMCCRIPEKRNG
jgi:hypothetical protein